MKLSSSHPFLRASKGVLGSYGISPVGNFAYPAYMRTLQTNRQVRRRFKQFCQNGAGK
jgi:hypothetical protein